MTSDLPLARRSFMRRGQAALAQFPEIAVDLLNFPLG